MRPVDITIIIISFNTRDLLLQCLASVFKALETAVSTGPLSVENRAVSRGFEVIVVDNGSADGSGAAVARYFPKVRLIENEFNAGFAAANNQAMRVSRGRYLLLLNPDTEVVGEAITVLIRFMNRHPRVGMVTGRLLNPDGSFQHSAFRFPTLWNTFFDFFPLASRLLYSRLNGRYSPSRYTRPFEIDHPLGACMLVRREVPQRVGMLSEDYFMYCEEVDWCFRIKRDDWEIYCEPQAAMVHHGGASTSQLADRMFVELHRSRLILFRQYYNPFFRVAVRAITAAGLLAEYARWGQHYLRGDAPPERLRSRGRACLQVAGLLLGRA